MNVLILVATPEEFEPYIRLPGFALDSSFGVTSASLVFGKHSLTVAQTGIGKVNAAFATTLLLLAKEFDVIINAGMCGSLIEAAPGTTYYCSAFVEYDLDLSSLGSERYPVYYPAPCHFVDLLEKSPYLNGPLLPALIATGDQFMTTHAPELDKMGVLICDMEFAAISRVVSRYNRPIEFIGIKMVSDSGNSEDYQANNKALSVKLAEQIIRHIDHFTLHQLTHGQDIDLSGKSSE